MKEKTIKGIEARKTKRKNTKAITIRLPNDIYIEFERNCTRLDKEKEKVIEDLIKEWID